MASMIEDDSGNADKEDDPDRVRVWGSSSHHP